MGLGRPLPLAYILARAAAEPVVVSGPGRAARRAKASAQAWPATCHGPAHARFPPCRAVLGPRQITVLWAVPRAHKLHAHLYLQQRGRLVPCPGTVFALPSEDMSHPACLIAVLLVLARCWIVLDNQTNLAT